MSISNFIFGENIPLLNLEKFSHYHLQVKNEFVMGKENAPIILNTFSELNLEQDKQDDYIFNKIHLKNITGSTDNEVMKPFLEQSLLLSEISPIIHIKRNFQGKILSVEQKEKLITDWEVWKKDKLKTVFTEEKDQLKFISNYENGLKDFEPNFKKNLQYLLLLPEIYSLIFPPNEHFTFLYSPLNLNSRLVEGMEYLFQMKLVKLEEETSTLSLELHSVTNNPDELNKYFLNKIYEAHPEFSLNDFSFKIEIRYLLEKASSKIISAELYFTEMLHTDLRYSITMNLEQSSDFNIE